MMTLTSYKSTNITPLFSTRNFTTFLCLIALLALLGGATSAQGQSPATGLVSTNIAGNGSANGGAYGPVVSADGRFVVFISASGDLVPNDTNGREDIFVRDRQTGLTKMVSINVSGTGGGDQHSSNPAITPDGRYVVFNSSSSNLASNDPTTLLYGAIFVRDLQLGITKLVTRNFTGNQRANGSSGNLTEPQAISPDGRFIAFSSSSTDLVANDTNNRPDIFVRDMQTNTTTLVSTGRAGSADVNEGAAHPVMTPDGRFVAFRSAAAIYVRDLQAGITKMVSVNRFGTGNGDRPSDEGIRSSMAISADGRYVAFVSSASDLVDNDNNVLMQDVFVRDTQSNTTSLVSVDSAGVGSGNAPSGGLKMTPDGHFITFTSGASNLVSAVDSNNKQDVFLRNLTTHTTTLMSINRQGSAGGSLEVAQSGFFDIPSISDDGRYVSFTSNGSDLTEVSDTNNSVAFGNDVFVRDTQAGITKLVSINNTGTASGNGSSAGPAMTPDGRYIVYGSNASDLVAHDSNGSSGDIFSFINIPQPGQIQFLTTVTNANENSATATITVTLLNGSSNPVSVDYTTLNSTAVAGVDYIAKSGTLSFNPGETSKTFDIQILDDLLDENDEKVIIRLSNPTNNTLLGEPSVAALSITDDDLTPTISINDVTVDEGDSGNKPATFIISLSAPSGRTVSVDVATADGSATAWSDYGPGLGTITFSPGVTTRSVAIPVIGDMLRELNETFVVDLTNPINAAITKGKGTGTIVDNDASQPNTLQFSRTRQTIGEWGGNASIEVTRTDTTVASTVDFATSDNFPVSQNCQAANTGIASARCDYATTTGTLQFAVGESSKTIFVPIVNDKISEGSETFMISLSNPTGSSLGSVSTVTMTIIDDEAPPGPIQLVLDESGPDPTQAAAIDSLLFLRDPFPVVYEASWWNQSADRNTRVILFVNNLKMEFIAPSSVVVNLTDGSNQIYNVAAADVSVVPGFSFSQVTFRLPDTLAVGTCTIKIKALGQESNSGTIRIRK